MENSFKNLEQIKLLFYPESLELSKVTTVLHDDLTFQIDDIFNLKEIKNLVSSKENLIEILCKMNDFISIDLHTNSGKIILSDNLIVYNFIHVPNKMTKEQLLDILEIKENEILRLYKQSLYWTMAIKNEDTTNEFENRFKSIKFEHDKSLHYETYTGKIILKQINKKIQNYSYAKETDNLKVVNGNSHSNRKDSLKDRVSTNSNSEAFSWRKKSDLSNDEKIITPHKGSFNKNVQNFCNSNEKFTRSRFNSEGNEKKIIETSNYDQEIIINPNTVNYSLKITNKYCLHEMYEFYNKIISNCKKPEFNISIEDICNAKPKKLFLFYHEKNKETKKDRSRTFNGEYEFKSSLTKENKKKLPQNNPLQDFK